MTVSREGYEQGQIIVMFKDGVTEPEARALIESAGRTSSTSSWGPLHTLLVIVPEGGEQQWVEYFQKEDIVAAACVDAELGLLSI